MEPLCFTPEEMTELLRIIDTLGEAGSDDPEIRAGLERFIAQAIGRRGKLQEQLAMADKFLVHLHEE